jgi:cephalosporin hydroxylase
MILDDGSHKYEHMLLSMQTLDMYVAPGGYYIIEDIEIHLINDLINSIPNTYEHIHTHYGNDNWDNYIILRKL